MAAFSSEKHHPFLLDDSSSSVFLFPNTNSANLSPTTITNNNNMSCFQNNYFSPLHHHHPFYDPTVDHVSSSINNISSTTTAKGTTCCSNNSSSSVVTAPHQLINPIHKRNNNFQLPHSKMNEKKQRKSGSNNSNIDEGCTMRSEGGEEKMTCKKKGKRGDDQKKKKKKEMEKEKEAPTGYIHVRARRGQATDSHSLAERVRREKISERMKVLQALVPGCDKVTGKALMLDEIINYVQSLQNQVEFLSMKIASVNPMLYDFGMDLDAVMVKPELQTKSLEAAEEENHCNQLDTTNIFNYTLMDSSSLLQFQQAQMPNVMSHLQINNGQLLWNMNEHKEI